MTGSGSEDMLRAIDSPMDERPPGTVSIGFEMLNCLCSGQAKKH